MDCVQRLEARGFDWVPPKDSLGANACENKQHPMLIRCPSSIHVENIW